MKCVVIQPNGHTSLQDMRGYDDFRAALDDGYLEAVMVDALHGAYVDEDGKAKSLQYNKVATNFIQKRLATIGRQLLPGDYIAGPMIVYGSPTEDNLGVESDVDDYVVEELCGRNRS